MNAVAERELRVDGGRASRFRNRKSDTNVGLFELSMRIMNDAVNHMYNVVPCVVIVLTTTKTQIQL